MLNPKTKRRARINQGIALSIALLLHLGLVAGLYFNSATDTAASSAKMPNTEHAIAKKNKSSKKVSRKYHKAKNALQKIN